MSQQEQWQVSGNAPEMYERYLVPALFRPWAPMLIAAAALQPGDRVLDVACGTGIVARLVAQQLDAHRKVVGLDLNAGMLTIARAHDLQGTVQWREGSAQAMPFPEEVFTLVLCQQGMQYFPDRVAALREMHRVLASGGRLVLSVWRAVERTPGFLVLSQALARHISPEVGVLPPFALGDAPGLAAEVARVGFHDVTTQTASRLLRYGSPEEFVHTYVISTPLADLLAQVEEARRTALLPEVSAALQPYLDGGGLVFPIESQIIMARK